MALTFAAYAVPGPSWVQRPVAVAAVLALAAVNYRGVTRTALLTRVLVAVSAASRWPWWWSGSPRAAAPTRRIWAAGSARAGRPYGVLQAAGLLFFAFAGYARIATMGEEVRDPQRTIPRAIPIALAMTVAVYRWWGSRRCVAARPGAARRATAPLRPPSQAAGAGWARSGRAGRRGAGRARRAAGADRRYRPHHPRDGPRPATCPAGWPPCTRASGCRTAPRCPRGRRQRAGAATSICAA